MSTQFPRNIDINLSQISENGRALRSKHIVEAGSTPTFRYRLLQNSTTPEEVTTLSEFDSAVMYVGTGTITGTVSLPYVTFEMPLAVSGTPGDYDYTTNLTNSTDASIAMTIQNGKMVFDYSEAVQDPIDTNPLHVVPTETFEALSRIYIATSTDTLNYALGTINITIETGKGFGQDQPVILGDTASEDFLYGTVTSYDETTGAMVVEVTNFVGSGSNASWNVVLSGQTVDVGGGTSIHNDLSGIQGGAAGDYQHLTTAQVTKLDGIEAGAEVNPTDAEIKTAYENNPDTNAFTDAEKSKLSGIEAGATADQTGAEIKAAYEAEPNAFTDAQFTKLAGIESGATADQTDAEIKTAYENNLNTNAFTDTEQTKLAGIETGATADQTGAEIKAAYEAEPNAFTDAQFTKLAGIEAGATADQTDAEIKTAYENNANTNAFTDAEQTKLAGIEAGATADQTGAEIKAAYEAEADTNAFTDAEQTKLAGIETGAQVNAPLASQAEAEAGVENTKTMTPLRVSQAISALGGGGGPTTPGTTVIGNITTWGDATGDSLLDSGVAVADIADKVTGPGSAVADNIALFDGTTGKLIKDSGQGLPTASDFNHNDLSSIQGGGATERYHMTLSEHTSATREATAAQNGLMSSAYATKLDGIEAGATGDQSDAEIKTAYENNPDTNAFTDAEKSKLGGIEAGAQVNADLASQAEAEAGVENTKTMTPLRVSQAIATQATLQSAYDAGGTIIVNTNPVLAQDNPTPVAGNILQVNNSSGQEVIGMANELLGITGYSGSNPSLQTCVITDNALDDYPTIALFKQTETIQGGNSLIGSFDFDIDTPNEVRRTFAQFRSLAPSIAAGSGARGGFTISVRRGTVLRTAITCATNGTPDSRNVVQIGGTGADSASFDFRCPTTNDATGFSVDANNDKVAMFEASPTARLHISADASFTEPTLKLTHNNTTTRGFFECLDNAGNSVLDFTNTTLTLYDPGNVTQMSIGMDTATGLVEIIANLPTSDPLVTGQWWNDGGTVKVSA